MAAASDAEPIENEANKPHHVTLSTAVVNINDQTAIRQVPASRGFSDKPSAAKFGFTVCNSPNKAVQHGNQIGKGLKKANPKPTRASFPGRKSAYVENSKCVAHLSSARSYLLDNPPGEVPEFKLKRRTNSAPVLLAPSSATHKTRTVIKKSNTSTNLLNTVSVNDWLTDYKVMRSHGLTKKMADGNGLPKSYPKMMELVKNLRMKSQLRGSQGTGELDFTVCGSAPGQRDPIDAWSPMTINLYDKYEKYDKRSGASTPSGDKPRTSTPAHSLSGTGDSEGEIEAVHNGDTSGSGDVSAEGSDVANHVLSLYNEDFVADKPSYSKHYEEGTGQMLNYYIHKEHRESSNNIHGRHSNCVSPAQNGFRPHKMALRAPKCTPREPVAPQPSPTHSRTSMREPQYQSEAVNIRTRPGGYFMGRLLRVGSPARGLADGPLPGHLRLPGGFLSIHRPALLTAREDANGPRDRPAPGHLTVRLPGSAPVRGVRTPHPHVPARPVSQAVGYSSMACSSTARSRRRADSCDNIDLVVRNGENSPKKMIRNSLP